MLNPIDLAFKKAKKENRPALLTFTVAGDSSKNQSLNLVIGFPIFLLMLLMVKLSINPI